MVVCVDEQDKIMELLQIRMLSFSLHFPVKRLLLLLFLLVFCYWTLLEQIKYTICYVIVPSSIHLTIFTKGGFKQ